METDAKAVSKASSLSSLSSLKFGVGNNRRSSVIDVCSDVCRGGNVTIGEEKKRALKFFYNFKV